MIERISHYRIIVRIGRGAMGEVYHAVDERLGRPVALKLLPASISGGTTEMQSRLLREAQAASALSHPGIVTVHDIGAWEGRVFMVMELVQGVRFSDAARAGIAVGEALSLVAEAADALAAAHARSIFHRDIKSDNLMRTRDGHAKVLDFGLAKLRDVVQTEEQPTVRSGDLPKLETVEAMAETLAPTERTISPERSAETVAVALESSERARSSLSAGSTSPAETVAGSILGTPAYMSPEQATGEAVDAVSEVFSLGVVLYELLTGVRPFVGDTIEATLAAIQHAPLVPPSRAAPTRKLPAFVDAIVVRALDRNRARRYPDMAAFATAIREARRRALGSARRPLVGAGVLAVLALLAAGSTMALRKRTPQQQPQPAVKTVKRITFESGCEEHPSFEADGHTVLYDARIDGDYEVFALDLASGVRTRLTSTPGWDYGVTPSPDGHTLAWLHRDDKAVQLEVGDLKPIAPRILGPASARPAWLRSGELLTSEGGGRIDALLPVTGARRAFASLDTKGVVTALATFDDGRAIALLRESDTEVAIDAIDARGQARRVVEHLAPEARGIAIAPSQDAFYYTRQNGNVHELVRHSLVDDVETVATGGSSPISIAVARDRKRLVYSTCAPSRHIVSLGLDGRTPDFTGAGQTRDDHPHVVNDRRVVFVSDRAGPMQIWLYDSFTHEHRPVTSPDTFSPSTSHDGRLLAYRDHAKGGLFVGDLERGFPTRITSDPSDDDPSFSSDDRTLVFRRGKKGIFAVSLDGGDPRALVATDTQSAVASPKGSDVLFLESRGDVTRLMETTLDGAAPRALDVALPPGDYRALCASPDGKRVAMLRNAQEVVEVGRAPGSKWTSRWTTLEERALSLSYDASGKSFLIALMHWEGDLWLAEGTFP